MKFQLTVLQAVFWTIWWVENVEDC